MDLFLMSLFAVQAIAVLAFVFFYNRDSMAERKMLYDRIQAGDFKEYKLLSDPPEPKKKEEKERIDFV